MSWITVIWSMVASACLTLAAMHLLIWFKKRAEWAHLLFSLAAAATAALAGCELWMMRAETPGQFGTALRWLHVPAWVIIVALVGFVLLYLRAGHPWLAWTICVLRTCSLLLDFLVGQNLNYLEVTRLRHIPFFGESVSVAEGVLNPWMLVGQLSLVLWVVFVVDAAITVWRRGDRRQALVVGAGIVFFTLAATAQSVLVLWEIVHFPITASLFYMGIVAAMGYEMSIEARRAADLSDELRQSQEWINLATDSAGVGIWAWDFKSSIIWATEKARTLYGFSADELIPFEKFFSKVHPGDLDWVVQASQRCLQEGADFRNDYRIVMPDGGTRWIRVLAKAFLTPSGKPERMTGISLDITENKRAEEELVRSQHLLRETGRVGKVGGWEFNVDTAKQIWTEETYNIHELDFTYEPTVERGIDFYTPDSRPIIERAVQRAIEHGEPFDLELEITTAKGNLRSVHVIGNADREHRRVYGFFQDITEHKQSEFEALNQRNQLAHVARVSMLGELATSLAHELNQPLGAILRNAEAAELFLQASSPDLEEVRDILADIRKDDQRAGAVIDRMRSLLKRREVEHSLLDLKLLADEVITLMRSEAGARKVSLALDSDSSHALVRGDRVQLQQVLVNLLLNAMDAMNNSAPDDQRVNVRIQAAGAQVEVAVSDTGQGIPADRLAHVFEPFFTTKPNGLGVGLPISRKIIEAHGGSIRAENAPHGGATFCFTLPVTKEGSAT
jgi:two-component system, LuxR family, sensor kinase FixL